MNYRTVKGEDRDYSDPNRKDLRRNGDRARSSYVIAEMYDKHHEIARRILLGENNKEIGEALNVTSQTISNVRNSPVVQDKLTVMRAVRDAESIDLAKDIMELAPIAILRLKEALETGSILGKELSASAIAKEANNLIDRHIGKPTQTINTRNVHGHFTLDDIERIKARAKELASGANQMAEGGVGGG